ncbi:helix-turn-helix domain-containing protein [Ferruginibacter sp. SUN002]|uniref:helix-turn-helix domain-containing protein n=1 Tax=Ferruginibacter sp. SUN002 TaxID=2937789 RepID=UPI003D36A5ED
MQNCYIPKSKEELIELIQEAVQESLVSVQKENTTNKYQDEIFSKKQAASYLKISLPTLSLRTNEGLIKASRIGSRVLYYKSDLDKALNNSKK